MKQIGDFNLKTDINEFTLIEFEGTMDILNKKELDSIDKYLSIFELLGMPEEISDKLDEEEFFKIIEMMKFDQKMEAGKELIKEITIDGYVYEAYEGDEYKLKIKDLALIESCIKKNGLKYLVESIAIIFKRKDLSRTEHYAPAHIKHKMELFKNVNAMLVYPYIIYIAEKIFKKSTELTRVETNN